jgi:hypothetical protein
MKKQFLKNIKNIEECKNTENNDRLKPKKVYNDDKCKLKNKNIYKKEIIDKFLNKEKRNKSISPLNKPKKI